MIIVFGGGGGGGGGEGEGKERCASSPSVCQCREQEVCPAFDGMVAVLEGGGGKLTGAQKVE